MYEAANARFNEAGDNIGPGIVLEEFRAHHRRQGQGNEPRNDHGACQSESEFEEQAAGRSRHEGDRRINGSESESHRHDGEADLAHARERGFEGLHTFLDVAEDVLQNDDGVIDDKADGEHHGEQSEHVDRQPGHQHDRESGDERDRDGDDRNHRSPERVQEEHDDQDDERYGLENRREHRFDRLFDKLRRIIADLGIDSLGQRGDDGGHHFA